MNTRTATTGELDGELSRLWATHRAEVDARLMTIEAAIAQSGDRVLDNESRAAGTRAAHQLAGTVGTFGFWGASEHAAALERLLLDTDTNTDLARFTQLLAALRAALAAHPS